LPPFQHPGDPKDIKDRLEELAKSMFKARPPPPIPLAQPGNAAHTGQGRVAAAYTYFGQFIMHDLTFDDTPFRSAGLQEPDETINYRNPRLDLDSVYGNGPFSVVHRHLYDGVRFRLGPVRNPNGAFFDVPLMGCFPAVADERNCENAILRQIHAMFLLLHNLAVDKLEEKGNQKGRREQLKLFEAARARVRWTFQRLVRHDFLPKVCDVRIYKVVIIEGQRRIHWPPGRFSIPVEFSQAAARFGHSMVRSGYILRKKPVTEEALLGELFGSTRRVGPLPGRKAVEWAHFANAQKTPAKEMDTRLVNPFADLPDEVIHPFITSPMPHEPHMLAVRTLCRGAATRLPTGQQLRVALQPNSTIDVSGPAQKLLRKLRFEHETPLWYYVLLEAESAGKLHLGPIGSRIIAEVIEAALLHDPDSFVFQENEEWRRDLLVKDRGGKAKPIKELSDLAVVVGL